MKRILLFVLTVFLLFPACAFPLKNVGKNVDSLFIFHPAKLAEFPFYSVFEQYTLCGKTDKLRQTADVKISTIAMMFSNDDAIFLVKSSLTPERFQKSAGKLGFTGVESIKKHDHTGYRFASDLTDGDNAILLFTGMEEFLFGEEKKVQRYLADDIKQNDVIKKCFAFLRKDAAAYGILTSSRVRKNGFLQSGNAGTIAFSLCRMDGMPSPVMAEVLFFPASSTRLMPLYQEIKAYIDNVYRTAAAKGPVSAEMRHAFTVTMSFGFVRLDMALTDANGKDFFRILLSQWKN